MSNWLNKQLGKYEIKEFLGRGAMAEVYKAYHPTLDRNVAIKIIHPHLASDPDFVGRFQYEAKIAAGLRHPGIVQVYDFDVQDDVFYMVIEFVAGESLKEYLQTFHEQSDWISLNDSLDLFRSIVAAVAYAHQQGVVHRDLKPSNVLLLSDGQPIITDFGLSQMVQSDRVSEPGMIVGTPAYMSPEQGCGETGDVRSDIYSLGVMLYELATGVTPYSGDTPINVILKHLEEPLPPPRSVNPDLPLSVEEFIEQALAKNPGNRFQSTDDMLTTLDAIDLPQPSALSRNDVIEDTRCPYRGLQVFEEEHAGFYFGREVLVRQLLDKLALFGNSDSPQFLAVLGASGSGKSSLVRAGLVPALRQGKIPGSAGWTIEVMRPGSQPLAELAVQLASVLIDKTDQSETLQELHHELASDGRTLHRIAQRVWPDVLPEQRLLLVIDQFEEIFTLCQDEAERRRFIENLLYATAVNDRRITVVITMRADFYHRCAIYRDLAGRVSTQQLLVGPMNQAELRRAIEQPAQQVGLKFETGLVESILDDVAQQPGALPLLQHALLELWERRQDGVLTFEAYRASGGVAGAIAQRADNVYESLSTEEQVTTRRIMLRLTQPGEGTEDTRRRVRKKELLSSSRLEDVQNVEVVLQQLADARLITTSRDAASGDEMVDVSHEALIRGWDRLRTWIDEDRAALRIHRALTEAAEAWEKHHRDVSYLYHGARLAQAEEWAEIYFEDLNELERDFLSTSRATVEVVEKEKEAARQRELIQAQALAEAEHRRADEQARSSRRLRWLSAGLAIVFLAAIVAAILAMGQQREAQKYAITAQARREIAEDAQVQALASEATAEARREVAETAQEQAFMAQATAEIGRQEAETAKEQAEVAEQIAAQEKERAKAQAQIALSRQLAAQTLTYMENLPGLALLLGLESNKLAKTTEARSDLLLKLAYSPYLKTLFNNRGLSVVAAALSPDDQKLAISRGNTIILWDMVTHQVLAELEGYTGLANTLDFSPDGQLLASAGNDGKITLWDMATGKPRGSPLVANDNSISIVTFSPDGSMLASTENEEIVLWDVATGQPLGEPLTGHADDVNDVTFNPLGNMLASASNDDTIILWDVATGEPLGQPLTDHSNNVRDVDFSPDGQTLASGSQDNTVILWDIATRQPLLAPLTGHLSDIKRVAFSPDGRILASAGGDKVIVLWDVTTGQPIGNPLKGHIAEVRNVIFDSTGQTLISEGQGNELILWNLKAARYLLGHGDAVRGVAFSPDRQTAASGSKDSAVILWDVVTGRPLGELAGHSADVRSVAFSPNGKIVASSGGNGEIFLWDVKTQEMLADLSGQSEDAIAALAFSPDGKILATGGFDKKIILWNVVAGQPLGPPLADHTGTVRSLLFTPDGQTLISASDDNTIIFWDVATGEILGEPLKAVEDGAVFSISLSPDGQILASGGDDQLVKLWSVETRQPIGQPFSGHTRQVNAVSFSPDGQTLASASSASKIILWDVATGRALSPPLTGHNGSVKGLAFSPDGKTLLSGSTDSTVILWELGLEPWSTRACRMANRNLTQAEWEEFIGAEIPYELTCPDVSE